MQYSCSALVFLALAGLGQAVIPACATKCLADATASATSCTAGDLLCQCTTANLALIQGAATACVVTSCTDPISVLTAANADCAAANAAGSSSSIVVAPTTSSTPETVTTSTSAAPATSTAPAPVTTSTSVAPTTSAAPTILITTIADTWDITSSATDYSNSNATVTTSSSTAQYTGGATQFAASLGGVAAIGVALFAGL